MFITRILMKNEDCKGDVLYSSKYSYGGTGLKDLLKKISKLLEQVMN
jgi:hypothetical protein